MRPWLRPLAVSMALTLAGLAAGELVARQTVAVDFPHPNQALTEMLQPDPDTFWSLRPGYRSPDDQANDRWGDEPIAINSHGMRSPEVTVQKPDGVRRVVVLGGSHPMGMWVKSGETYSAVLERLLNARGDRWQVLNTGVVGYTSWQGVLQMRHKLLPFEPDIVVSDLGINDGLARVPWGLSRPDHRVRRTPWLVAHLTDWLRANSVAYRFALQRLTAAANGGQSARVSRQQHREHVLEIQRIAAESGARTVFMNHFTSNVISPGVVDPGPSECTYPESDLDPVVDVCGIFMPRLDLGELFADPVHANATGHAMIAEAMLDRLVALGWVE
jgi:lysophospholipase L1-like esterase